jgi:hypothetical protein
MIKPPTWVYLIGLVLIIAWYNLFDDFHSYKGKEGMLGTSSPPKSSSYCIPSGTEVNMYGSTVCCSGSAVARGNQYFCT